MPPLKFGRRPLFDSQTPQHHWRYLYGGPSGPPARHWPRSSIKTRSDNAPALPSDAWRPQPSRRLGTWWPGKFVGNIFAGIDVDVAVRDSDAWLYRLGYNITLLGKIVFVNNTPQ